MNSQEIREKFITFFSSKNHKVEESGPMVIKKDPTLMFTNAGMNQFKDIFLDNCPITAPRVVNSQKCLRVSGKHNDLEEVGIDTYHHTMFEMLGNWSFGDYFKKEAIHLAWEFLTKELKIEKNNLYFTVFEGYEKDNLPQDEESYQIWKAIIEKENLAKDHLLLCKKKDNFWEMGATGPSGASSEIHIDLRSEEEKNKLPGKDLVNKNHPLVIEIWNLVFIAYNRKSNGTLEPLKTKHVDTGMGLERLAMVMQKKKSNYDTDVFQPLITKISELSKVSYQRSSSKTDIAIRVIADHIRAVSIAISEGLLPSNNGAGYVIRRILRRAIGYGYNALKMNTPFIYSLTATLVNQLGEQYKELKKNQDLTKKIIFQEEKNFLNTLSKGIEKFETYIKSNSTISGEFAFELYDTFGFPIDFTKLMADRKNITLDLEKFEKRLKDQKNRSKKDATKNFSDWIVIKPTEQSEFIGYSHLKTTANILKYRTVQEKQKTIVELVLDKTPFYPQGGGQEGDIGILKNTQEEIKITDVRKENGLIIHKINTLPKTPKTEYIAEVNTNYRKGCSANHSATHLLHFALRKVLGKHVEQKGSFVGATSLRFDFQHFEPVSDTQVIEIETLVNKLILANSALITETISLDEAKKNGVTMLFGEKYGSSVRCVTLGESSELCGGTHVTRTGEIGYFKLLNESAVASGIRRIEAITSIDSLKKIQYESSLIKAINKELKYPKDLVEAILKLKLENKTLQKKIELSNQKNLEDSIKTLENKIVSHSDYLFLADTLNLATLSDLKTITLKLASKHKKACIILGCKVEDKVAICLSIDKTLVEKYQWHAGNAIKEAASIINGGGGGQAHFASSGGNNTSGLQKAIDSIVKFLAIRI